MASEILNNVKIVWVDDGWQIPNSDPPTTMYTVKLEVNGDRDTYKTLDDTLKEGYQGDIEVYTAKSGKTYIRKGGAQADKPSQAKQYSSGKDITLGLVWKTVAGIRGLPTNDTEFTEFFEIVKSHLEELVLMSEKMRDNE